MLNLEIESINGMSIGFSPIRRGVPFSDCLCSRCGMGAEDPDHIFIGCLWARSIWWSILVWMRISFPVDIVNINELMVYIHKQPGSSRWKRVVYTVALATIWRLWNARNEMIFNGRFIPVSSTVDLIKEDAFLWLNNRSNIKSLSWENWGMFDISCLM
ncbi:hypothetical protein HanXRQr2_Chr05g0207631 [Helianthus annuus]|uniref:Reverse transcriptase zinc-binding domain-containing protein n=1 Tax=Helianthus annuus TaxID=4232 RepID=A0A9K3NLT1_HELAN|nr:hypothetical protein HanXRQr2_Chr05g0207631 [Helianthus annuus]KAJ0584088.1 hypothetical protein HanHA89_Chr05g0184481 [Helianthus annuus]KAJ0639097.1 hypothetical protein HanHA300_Chr00c0003g0677861 [Helianthus annuus]KAJ0746676.1 hypothetical protein HanOQP8_Chr05g0180701 [Helianthus annuus]KAJ0749755.1 hypothetical protein HanLR1_Chr05g0173851 [Helianthus annuus]